jgi:hypothetical protein
VASLQRLNLRLQDGKRVNRKILKSKEYGLHNMAIALLNAYIALDSVEPFSGNERVMKGTVKLIGNGVTGIAVGNTIFYPKEAGMEVMHNGKEYMVVKQAQVIGKL